MGSKGSKQTNGRNALENDKREKPAASDGIDNSDSEYESKLQQRNGRHKLGNPSSQRPVELSWLQQNRSNDNYNRSDHHHDHHHEHPQRMPLAINRWPKDNDQSEKQKAKTFIEEYIHQP